MGTWKGEDDKLNETMEIWNTEKQLLMSIF